MSRDNKKEGKDKKENNKQENNNNWRDHKETFGTDPSPSPIDENSPVDNKGKKEDTKVFVVSDEDFEKIKNTEGLAATYPNVIPPIPQLYFGKELITERDLLFKEMDNRREREEDEFKKIKRTWEDYIAASIGTILSQNSVEQQNRITKLEITFNLLKTLSI